MSLCFELGKEVNRQFMNKYSNRKHLLLAALCLLVILSSIGGYFIYKHIENSNRLKMEASGKHLKGYNSRSIYVYDLTDGKVVKNLNGRERLPMASLTKLMTCRKALQIMDEKKLRLREKASITKKAYNLTVEQKEIMVGYKVGEKTSFADLLYAMIMQSDGACSNAIADILRGTITGFIGDMNREAHAMGLKNTHYESVEGVDKKKQYTTGEDVTKLLVSSLKDKDYYKIFTDRDFKSSTTSEHPDGLSFSNAVICKFEEYKNKDFKILGGKFGYTPEAGKSLATLVEKNKKKYIVVTLGHKSAPESYAHVEDVIKIMKTAGNK